MVFTIVLSSAEISAKYMDTSSKTGHNIDHLFMTVADDYITITRERLKGNKGTVPWHASRQDRGGEGVYAVGGLDVGCAAVLYIQVTIKVFKNKNRVFKTAAKRTEAGL